MASIFPSIRFGGVLLKGPSADGSNGQGLITDGSGSLSFASLARTDQANTFSAQQTVKGDGSDFWRVQDALGQNLIEADTINGKFVIRQLGGTAGTGEAKMYHDGLRAWIDDADTDNPTILSLSQGGSEYYRFMSGRFYPEASGVVLGKIDARWGVLYIDNTLDVDLNSDTQAAIKKANATQTANLDELQADDSGGTSRMTAAWTGLFVDSTASSFKTRGLLKANDFNAEREAIRWEGDGSQALLGFFGAAAVAKQAALTAKDAGTVDTTYGQSEADVITNNRTRIEEIETRLQNLGLMN